MDTERESLADYASGINEPFCACGRRWSQCDGSRRGCRKHVEARMDTDWNFDLYPSTPSPAPPARVSTEKVGPRSLNRDDAAIAAEDNARVRRTSRSRSKVAR